ncbi:MAG: trypsin-like peptidase domain-containing protein [Candidatus Shapirobacteria bacterium]|jgi:S1-C subfamily serine protease|nr:trypsin-like peptidase domain-containing protein [Candidatus Shapirobacteria bacterium]
MKVKNIKWLVIGLFLGLLVMFLIFKFGFKKEIINITKQEILDEESMVIRVVENSTMSVVTIRTDRDLGTGFIISQDGLIVTNKHVVVDLEPKYKVVIGKDEIVEVKNIYRDPLNDLAILKIDKTGLKALNLGDSDKLKVGQSLIAIGTALGEFRSTVTTGVVSGLGRGIVAGSPIEGIEKLTNVIQTDAAINPGNSGGPLFNSGGQVVGVNVAVSQSGQNIGFALPINLIKESINIFKTTGEFERPYLGVGYKMISKEVAAKNKINSGAYVESITENSPAYKAKIQKGDIIIEIDGQKLTESDNGDLVKIINTKKIGEIIALKYFRDNKEQTVSVKLEKRQ